MKKLAAYIAVGFLSVGVASPALSDVDCAFIEEQVGKEFDFLKVLDATMSRKIENKTYDETYYQSQKLTKEVQQSLNSYANVYSTFCK